MAQSEGTGEGANESKQKQPLTGKRVVEVRRMTDEEMETEGWHARPGSPNASAIVFSNGSVLYGAKDTSSNGPGALIGMDGDRGFLVSPPVELPENPAIPLNTDGSTVWKSHPEARFARGDNVRFVEASPQMEDNLSERVGGEGVVLGVYVDGDEEVEPQYRIELESMRTEADPDESDVFWIAEDKLESAANRYQDAEADRSADE